MRYLKGFADHEIVMTNDGHTQITGYSNSNWAGNAIDRKLTTGFCIFSVVKSNMLVHVLVLKLNIK